MTKGVAVSGMGIISAIPALGHRREAIHNPGAPLDMDVKSLTHWLCLHGPRQVQYMASHRFVSSTERYQVGQIADLQRDLDRFHPAD